MADYLTVVYGEDVRPYTEYPSKLITHLFERFKMKPILFSCTSKKGLEELTLRLFKECKSSD